MAKVKLTKQEEALIPFIESLNSDGKSFDRKLDETISGLEQKGLVSVSRALVYGKYSITNVSVKRQKPKKERDFSNLAKAMIECFPKGNKESEGRSYPWRLSLSATVARLKKLVEDTGEDFSDEDALRATKAYVLKKSSDVTHMRLLKYFIFKNTAEGLESDLLAWIASTSGLTDEELSQEQEVLTDENFL